MGPRWKKGFCANFLRFPLTEDGSELWDKYSIAESEPEVKGFSRLHAFDPHGQLSYHFFTTR
jgi:hypothetical protein